jgi:hypothetical protein
MKCASIIRYMRRIIKPRTYKGHQLIYVFFSISEAGLALSKEPLGPVGSRGRGSAFLFDDSSLLSCRLVDRILSQKLGVVFELFLDL